jgi:RHS repeat-associated protein
VVENLGTEGSRYRWIGEVENGIRTRTVGEYEEAGERYRGMTLYGRGEAVSLSTTRGTVYLGKDVLGSVRTTTGVSGSIEERYEYDVFGVPYTGDLTQGMDLGYTGKPYDAVTGLYDYGYRDYKAEAARFTSIDPIRDGSNWYAYVNNDPVNWRDPWGLSASDGSGNTGNDNSVSVFGDNEISEYRVEITYYILKITDTNSSGRYELTLDKGELLLKDTTIYGHDNPYIYTSDKSARDLANERAGFSGNQILPSGLHPDGIEPNTIVVIDIMDITYGNRSSAYGSRSDSIEVDVWGYRELPNE